MVERSRIVSSSISVAALVSLRSQKSLAQGHYGVTGGGIVNLNRQKGNVFQFPLLESIYSELYR